MKISIYSPTYQFFLHPSRMLWLCRCAFVTVCNA